MFHRPKKQFYQVNCCKQLSWFLGWSVPSLTQKPYLPYTAAVNTIGLVLAHSIHHACLMPTCFDPALDLHTIHLISHFYYIIHEFHLSSSFWTRNSYLCILEKVFRKQARESSEKIRNPIFPLTQLLLVHCRRSLPLQMLPTHFRPGINSRWSHKRIFHYDKKCCLGSSLRSL